MPDTVLDDLYQGSADRLVGQPAVFLGTVLWEHGQCKIAHIVYFCFLVAGLIGFYNV